MHLEHWFRSEHVPKTESRNAIFWTKLNVYGRSKSLGHWKGVNFIEARVGVSPLQTDSGNCIATARVLFFYILKPDHVSPVYMRMLYECHPANMYKRIFHKVSTSQFAGHSYKDVSTWWIRQNSRLWANNTYIYAQMICRCIHTHTFT